jgi:hypothetical protein
MQGSRARKDVVIANIKQAKSEMINGRGEFTGFRIVQEGGRKMTAAYGVMRGSRDAGDYMIDANSSFWVSPNRSARQQRRTGFTSSSSPRHAAQHEIGHAVHQSRTGALGATPKPSPRVARRVSQYAKANANEFVAETYAGLRTGRKYDHQVMRAYRREMNQRNRNIRSQLRGLK